MKKDVLFIVIASLFLVLFIQIYSKTYLPVYYDAPEQTITIRDGSSVRSIALLLESAGIIRSANMLSLLSRITGQDNLKAGEYVLNPGMYPFEILKILDSGHVLQRKITIPEGLTIFQIADILDQESWIKKSTFLEHCFDPNILQSWDIQGRSLEGYLFPETYFFSKGVSEKYILQSMVKQFWRIFTPDMSKRAKELDYTVHEIVTIASLIEKETALPDERPLISAVFHNRLKGSIPLQCDPTVIYGLKGFDGNLRKIDLLKETPYNTYLKTGLPPSPIANPGLDSLLAALYPAKVNYKYFVSKNNGAHVFSETLEEHNRAVYKFQKRRIKKL